MDYKFDNNIPIYIQISELIKIKIVSGELKTGDRLLSVRELALAMKVNPNTIVKALSMLEDEKLIYTERTNGKYVTNDIELISKIRKDLADEKVRSYLNSMKDIGINYSEALKYLQNMKG